MNKQCTTHGILSLKPLNDNKNKHSEDTDTIHDTRQYEQCDKQKVDHTESFDCMKLKHDLLKGIYSIGFEIPSVIQSRAIPEIIKKEDVIAQAQSGTGKTGTFVIGMLQNIDETLNKNQAIILSPTRELATQINSVVEELSKYMKVTTTLCIGGVNVHDNHDQLEKGQIVIGTPGRINDVIKRKYLNLKNICILILDEADELLARDFREQVRVIVESLPSSSQICIFSATMSKDTIDLAKTFMYNPKIILVEKEYLTLEGIKQFLIDVNDEMYKLEVFCDIYEQISINQSIVYVNTREKAEWLSEKLKGKNFTVSMIHSKMTSFERSKIIKDFRNGSSRVLISTDLLSRGIDVQQLSIVINYDLPLDNDNYLHRIGRSGRYGRKGVAINFVTKRDRRKIYELEKYYSIKIDEMPKTIAEYIEKV